MHQGDGQCREMRFKKRSAGQFCDPTARLTIQSPMNHAIYCTQPVLLHTKQMARVYGGLLIGLYMNSRTLIKLSSENV
jgi:hypothetical protein